MSSRQMQRLLVASLAATAQSASLPPARGRKRATNVTIDEDVLNEAKNLGINLSQTLETALREIIRQIRIKEWSNTNQKAVASYNKLLTPETK